MTFFGLTDKEDVYYVTYEGKNIAIIGHIATCEKIMKKLGVKDMRGKDESQTTL